MANCTKLENLPNEILIHVFEYVSLDDLYRSLKGLNQRLNDLLQSIRHRALRLWSSDTQEQIEICRFFAPTISSLFIHDDSSLSLDLFSNIHSLNFTYATDGQLEQFLSSTFSHHQLISLDVASANISPLVQFMATHQFPSLRHLSLRNIDSISLSPWRLTPSLVSMAVCADDHFLSTILRACPRLKHLSVFVYELSTNFALVSIRHSHLKYLTIDIYQPGWTTSMLAGLFQSIEMPNLHSLCIYSQEPSTVALDFLHLAQIFDQRVPHLKQFNCGLKISSIPKFEDLRTVKSSHPSLFKGLHINYLTEDVILICTRSTDR